MVENGHSQKTLRWTKFLPLRGSYGPKKGAEEQNFITILPGKCKDIHLHRILWEQEQGWKNSSEKASLEEGMFILEIWGREKGKRDWAERTETGKSMEGVPECV